MEITLHTLQEKDFHPNKNFAISLMANSLNLNSIYLLLYFRNLSSIAYIIEIKNQKLLIFISLKSTNLIKVANLNYVYILIM